MAAVGLLGKTIVYVSFLSLPVQRTNRTKTWDLRQCNFKTLISLDQRLKKVLLITEKRWRRKGYVLVLWSKKKSLSKAIDFYTWTTANYLLFIKAAVNTLQTSRKSLKGQTIVEFVLNLLWTHIVLYLLSFSLCYAVWVWCFAEYYLCIYDALNNALYECDDATLTIIVLCP